MCRAEKIGAETTCATSTWRSIALHLLDHALRRARLGHWCMKLGRSVYSAEVAMIQQDGNLQCALGLQGDFRGGRLMASCQKSIVTLGCVGQLTQKLSEMIAHMSLVITPGTIQKSGQRTFCVLSYPYLRNVLCPFLSRALQIAILCYLPACDPNLLLSDLSLEKTD